MGGRGWEGGSGERASLLLLLLFIELQEEVVAGDGEGPHQDDELGEVHLPVSIGVQVTHHLVHRLLVLGILQGGSNLLSAIMVCVCVCLCLSECL